MKHLINVSTPITEDIISNFHISVPDITNLIDYTSDTPLKNNFNGTQEEYEHYMQTEASTIFITDDAYKSLLNENKIYYMFNYSANKLINNINRLLSDIEYYVYPVVFLKKPYDTEYPYHIWKLINKDDPHLKDVTALIKGNYKYWISTYAPVSYNTKSNKFLLSDDIVNISLIQNPNVEPSYFFDTKEEAIIDMLDYLHRYCVNEISPIQARYIMLDSKFTYDKIFKQIYDERLANLKEDIENELASEKNEAKQQVEQYNDILVKLQEKRMN